MASLHVIAAELGKIFVLYRQPEPDNTEFEALARIWADVLPDVSDAELTAALRRVCARSRFFPLPADVTRQVDEFRQQPTPALLAALPEQTRTFDEQSTLNREWGAKILEMLRDQNRKHSRRPLRPDFKQAVGDLVEGIAQ